MLPPNLDYNIYRMPGVLVWIKAMEKKMSDIRQVTVSTVEMFGKQMHQIGLTFADEENELVLFYDEEGLYGPQSYERAIRPSKTEFELL